MLLLMAEFSYCQENYLPGYFVRVNGDTVKGFIDYRNWDRNPEKVFFKETVEGERSTYFPLQIKSFGVMDESYESAVVQTEVSPSDISNLNYSRNLEIKTDTAFLQAVVKGRKSLYYNKTRSGIEQYYIWQDTAFNLLIYKKYLMEQDGRQVIVENKTWLGQLTLYLNDCPSLPKMLKNLDYQKYSLEKLFLDYYAYSQSPVKFHTKTETVHAQFGVLAGVSSTTLKIEGDNYNYLVKAGYKSSVNFSGGLFLNLVLPRSQGKWSIYNELLYTSYQVSGSYTSYSNTTEYIIIHTTLGYTYLKLNTMVRFKYPFGKFFVFVNGGLSNGLVINEKNYARVDSKLMNQVDVYEAKALNDTRKYEIGYVVGAGAGFWKFSLDFRYERANGITVYSILGSHTDRFYCFLGYRF